MAPGEVLRRHREAQGYELEDVAKRLHLPVRMVEALEEDRYQDLPEPPYVKGYIGAYARFLDLDAAPLIAGYQERTHPEDPTIFSSHMPAGGHSHRVLFVWGTVAVIVVLMALLANWWSSHRPEDTSLVGEAGQERTEAPPRPSTPVAPTATQARGELATVPAAPPAERVAPPPARQVEDSSEPVVAAPVSSPPPITSMAPPSGPGLAEADTSAGAGPVAPGRHRFQLSFGGQSWTEIYDSDDKRLLFDLLKAGERRTVVGKTPFRIVLGNARVVRVELDGRPVEVAPDALRGSTARFTVDAPDSP